MMTGKILCGPPIQYSAVPLGPFIFKQCEEYKDRICQVDAVTDQSETYARVKLRSTRVAIALQQRGVTPQDIVIVCSSNTMDNTIPMLATFYLGAKLANLEPSMSVRQTKHLLALVPPKIMFVQDTALGLIEESLRGEQLPEIVVFGESQKYSTFSDMLKPQVNEEEFTPKHVDVNDVAVVAFSSGTTGLAKKICHSYASTMFGGVHWQHIHGADVLLHFNNFYWFNSIFTLLATFGCGGCRVFSRSREPVDTFKIIEKWKVTVMTTAPHITAKLLNYKDAHNYDTATLKVIVCMGAPMNPLAIKALNDLFPSAITVLRYGTSECGCMSAFHKNADKKVVTDKAGFSGTTAPGVRLKFVDLVTRKPLGPHTTGEICSASPGMMIGYEKTGVYDDFEDDFLKTGDIGYYDDDGCVYVTGRIKSMFKYQNWHVVPEDLENILTQHPAVEEAVVFGLPAGDDGEVPAAYLILRPNTHISIRDINQFLETKVSEKEKLRGGITFVEKLPRSLTGKIARQDIKNDILGRHLKDSK